MGPDLLQDLFIFEIANNHQGDLRHGLNLVRSLGALARHEKIKAAVKFQFRDLKTFLSESHRQNPDSKARRFLSTELSRDEFATLLTEVKAQGMLSMCTPFDEPSADLVKEMGFDFVKVASCSAADFPLLRKISGLGLPTVASTAGLGLSQVETLVRILSLNNLPLAIMHCVALYPTENNELCLDRITALRARFPELPIGFSTHERPDNLLAVQLAYAQGARLFEKHVGLPTAEIALNPYSASPEQLANWIRAWKVAKSACDSRAPASQVEREASALRELKRACVARQPIQKGESLGTQNVSFSLCLSPDQLLVENFEPGSLAHKNYEAGEPILKSNELIPHLAQLEDLMAAAGLEWEQGQLIEASHHHGPSRFTETGAFILPLAAEPLRKLLVILPNQSHPVHFHEEKNETFRILHGTIRLELDGAVHILEKGDEIQIPKHAWHRFSSPSGAVVEELADLLVMDSIYPEEEIGSKARSERKTRLAFATRAAD